MNSSFQYTGNLAIDNFNLNNFNFISSDQCWGRISRHEVWRTFLRLGEGVNSNIKSSKISTEIRGEDKTRFSPFIPPPPQTQIWFWKPTYHCFDQIGLLGICAIYLLSPSKPMHAYLLSETNVYSRNILSDNEFTNRFGRHTVHSTEHRHLIS